MLIGYLIDGFCRMILYVLAMGVIGFFVTIAVIMIGEKMKWW